MASSRTSSSRGYSSSSKTPMAAEASVSAADTGKAEAEAKAAKAEAEAKAAAQDALATQAKAAAVTKVAVKKTGDVMATSLVNNPHVRMGKRRYNLQKGKALEMNPSHVTELAQRGLVVGMQS